MSTKKKSTTKAAAKKAAANSKKLSQIAAAVQVLAKTVEPMNCTAMVEAMIAKGLWSSPKGKTPAATLYASILRELNTKSKDARFVKKDRGLFALAGRKEKRS
jgi:hypothetical protein